VRAFFSDGNPEVDFAVWNILRIVFSSHEFPPHPDPLVLVHGLM